MATTPNFFTHNRNSTIYHEEREPSSSPQAVVAIFIMLEVVVVATPIFGKLEGGLHDPLVGVTPIPSTHICQQYDHA